MVLGYGLWGKTLKVNLPTVSHIPADASALAGAVPETGDHATPFAVHLEKICNHLH